MNVRKVCNSYFNGFFAISSKETSCCDKSLAFLKILSYFTVILPLAFGIVLGIATLRDRCSPIEELSKDSSASMTAEKVATVNPNLKTSRQENAACFANQIKDVAKSVDKLKAIFTNDEHCNAVGYLYLALKAYGETGDLAERIHTKSDQTVEDIFKVTKKPAFSTLLSEMANINDSTAKTLGKSLVAIQKWIARVLPTA